MKVTVIFGETRVVVPCGQGDFHVSELLEKAIVRYRKAAGKPIDHYVHIHTLKSESDGGILDLDDLLSDVVDDREQIIAEYEEHTGPSAPQGGDGTSGSSVGSASPDVFQTKRKHLPPTSIPDKANFSAKLRPNASTALPPNIVRSSPALYADINTEHDIRPLRNVAMERTLEAEPMVDMRWEAPSFQKDGNLSSVQNRKSPPVLINTSVDQRHSVEVTELDLNTGTGLQVLSVRRDSEPNIALALEQESFLSAGNNTNYSREHQISKKHDVNDSSEEDERSSSPDGFTRFARDSSRQSLNTQNVLKWASAAEHHQLSHDDEDGEQPAEDDDVGHTDILHIQTSIQKNERREPLGQSQSPGEERTTNTDSDLVVLKNEDGPLGIHVIPNRDEYNRESGLAIQSVEPGGRVHRCGQIETNDVIVEINGRSLRQINFTESQEIFRDALQTEEIRLRLHRPLLHDRKSNITPSTDYSKQLATTNQESAPENNSATVHSLFRSVPPQPPARSPHTALSTLAMSTAKGSPPTSPQSPTGVTSTQALIQANTRKLGKRINIELTKGPEGLGFSITTRDNPAGGLAPPIYVKNILPKGAAIADGRLKSGDRLLEVNSMDMTGKSQEEVVAVLRNTKRGSTVALCVSRVDNSENTSSLPRHMPPLPSSTAMQTKEVSSEKQLITFDIPLNETGSAGLGISVKGKTSTSDGVTTDLGIFIKAVIHGGAASKDGRLQINDQLLAVNDDDLSKKTNSEAMTALRQAMHTEGPTPGHIKLRVERKLCTTNNNTTAELLDLTQSSSDNMQTSHISMELLRKPEAVQLEGEEPANYTRAVDIVPVVSSAPADASVIDHKRNPVLDRITGGHSSGKLRNESYHIATQEDSEVDENYDPPSFANNSTIPFPTSTNITSNVVMIEDDNEHTILQQPRRKEELKAMTRPLSTIGGIGIAAKVEAKQKRDMELEQDKRSVSPQPPTPNDESHMNTFDREAFGRRSFSEKRKASNGKNKEVVAKVKALREERKLELESNAQSGSVQHSKHSGPYKIKSLTIDYSVTSAYQGSSNASIPLNVPDLPSSPLYLQRATSHKNPPRPSVKSDTTQASPHNTRHRTYSTSSLNTSANGRPPVPAPRHSICSQTSVTLEYQPVNQAIQPDVQVKDGISPAQIAFGQSLLYPEIADPVSRVNMFTRSSTLPVSAQRPALDTNQEYDQNSRFLGNLAAAHNSRLCTSRYCDNEGMAAEGPHNLTSECKPYTGNRRGIASTQLSTRISNSRTSLTDVEKAERRKSDLLESSPYPQLYNLALEDKKQSSTDCADELESRVQNTRASQYSKYHIESLSNIKSSSLSTEPIYTQINKSSISPNQCTQGVGRQHPDAAFVAPSDVSSGDGADNKTGRQSASVNGDGVCAESRHIVYEDRLVKDISGGLVYAPVMVPSALPSNADENVVADFTSPIYEKIGSEWSDNGSLPSPSLHAHSQPQISQRLISQQQISQQQMSRHYSNNNWSFAAGTEGCLSNIALVRAGSAESLPVTNRLDVDNIALNKATNACSEYTGPTLGPKKNRSYESLQAMITENESSNTQRSLRKTSSRVARARGCNESFRAAVDRSYEPPQGGEHMMPEISDQSGGQHPSSHHISSNVHAVATTNTRKEGNEFPSRGASVNASFSGERLSDGEKKKGKKKDKKDGGILGLFRLTKARKSLDERGHRKEEKNRFLSESGSSNRHNTHCEPENPYAHSSEIQEKIQDYYRKLQEKQKTHSSDADYQQQSDYGTYPRGDRLRINASNTPPPIPSHANNDYQLTDSRAHQLANIRAQHQRRHNERQGQYPHENVEDFYERKIKEREREWQRAHHRKTRSIDSTSALQHRQCDEPSNLEFFADVNNRAYGSGAEFNPRHKSSQPKGTSRADTPNRYSFYADPRYHDYHRSTQAPYYSDSYEENGSLKSFPSSKRNQQQLDLHQHVMKQPSPYLSNTAYMSTHKPNHPELLSHHSKFNKSAGNVFGGPKRPGSADNRFTLYDSLSDKKENHKGTHDLSDYDDPCITDNSVYAQIRKASITKTTSNPARV